MNHVSIRVCQTFQLTHSTFLPLSRCLSAVESGFSLILLSQKEEYQDDWSPFGFATFSGADNKVCFQKEKKERKRKKKSKR